MTGQQKSNLGAAILVVSLITSFSFAAYHHWITAGIFFAAAFVTWKVTKFNG